MGLKLVGEDRSVDLGMGTIRATFHSMGRVPFRRERLNKVVKLLVTEVMVALSIFTEMSSGPVDFESSSSAIKSYTSSSVQKYSRLCHGYMYTAHGACVHGTVGMEN